MKKLISVFFLLFTFVWTMVAAPPVPFSGKLAVDGKNFHGNALFAFSIVDGEGKVHWNHSEKQGAAIENFVVNGRYLVLLGGQGMQALPANLFLENDNLFLRVRVDLQDGQGIRLLEPDQPITSTPYALAAELARLAEKASVADGVTPGAITAGMIDTGLLADLNRTAGITEITREMLPQDVRDDLNRTITRDRLSSDVLSDINRTITKSMLSQEVLNELNSSSGGGGVVADGSVTASKLSSEVSNALKPVVVEQPSSVVEVGGYPAYLAVDATGVNNSYQWKKNGVDIAGATNHTLSIADLNASQHEGNYTLVVSNAFGSATSSVAQIDVNGSLTEGLVGWWKFDETDGDVAYDSSGNGNDGNLTNGPAWTDGKIGGALNFDGVDDLLKLPSTMLNGLKDFSASFHFLENLNNTDHHHFISVANTSTANRFILGLESNYEFNINDSITGASLLNYLSTHNFINWSPIAVSRNSSTTKLFVSGILVNHASHSGESLTISENGLWVGGDQDSVGGGWSSSQQLNGSIDDLRIYDRALSDFEIKSLHELGEEPVQVRGGGTTTVVNGTVADGSITASKIADQTITTNQLSEQILKYLKPEITTQPQPIASTIFADTNASLSVSAEGKYLTYQWKKNGTALAGETNATLTITDANSTQHDGNYSVVVSNDFGSVESGEVELLINHSLLEGLIAWWKFDEMSGTVAYDSSGNGHDANLTNGPAWVTGKIGGALSFDGTDDMVRTGVSGMYNQDFTWSTWIKTSDTSGAVVGVSADSWSNGGSSLYIFGGKPKIDVCNIGNKLGSLSINTNQWVHYLLTVEDSGGSSDPVKIFVNGQIDVDSQMNWFGFSGQAFKLRIGHVPVHGDYYSGIIDDVRIYDRVLSNTEVQDLYQLGQ